MTRRPNQIPELPNGELAIIALDSIKEQANEVDRCIVERRKLRLVDYMKNGLFSDDTRKSYLLDSEIVRFSDGEAKCVLRDSARGKDVYIMSDIGNYSCKYTMYGKKVNMGPDEHFQDIKRAVSAVGGKARRISVIMPRLYASRQDKRVSRESLDCAMGLQELQRLGVKNILTFDAHSSKVQNAIPNCGFENLFSSFNFIEKLIEIRPEIELDPDKLIVVSPDSGGMDRAIFYANTLGLDVGMFYKRRDYKRLVDGTHPIVKHEYMGSTIKGKDVLVVDDMIASGGSMFDLMKMLKKKGANNIYICVTFALFTSGITKFNDYYKKGYFTHLFATNLGYIPENIKNKKWFISVNMSDFIGDLINELNYDHSISPFFDDISRINELLNKR